jgi:hypothetical protein
MQILFIFFLICLGSQYYIDASISEPNVKFGNTQSSISLINNGELKNECKNFVVDGGQINRAEDGNITGNPFYFNRGILGSYLSSSFMSGRYEPNILNVEALTPYYDPNDASPFYGALELGFNPDPFNDIDFMIANPGGLRYKLYIRALGQQFLRGQPLFFGKNDIVFDPDGNALLVIGIQNTLNTNIILNSGYIVLQDDLKLGDDAVLKNGGTVFFNNRKFSLGGGASTWDSTILWDSALDLQLNNQTKLRGTWTFKGDGQINGNGNVLDISNGGTIVVLPGSILRLSGIVLKGLGSGNFYMGENSYLILSDVEIEMDANFTFDSGNVWVIGDTRIITKDKFLTFTENEEAGTKGTLTVDSVALTYDPLGYGDKHNIQPTPEQDPTEKFVKILGKGSIRTLRVESISFAMLGNNSKLQRYIILWPERPMTIYAGADSHGQPIYDFTIDGGTQFLGFTSSETPLLTVDTNVHVIFENILFRDFAPSQLELEEGASLVFGNESSIRVWQDDTLNYPWVFQGNTTIRGGGAIITLGENGEIVLKGENSILLIEGITLKGISGTKIRCESNTSKIIFQNVKWVQDDDFTFGTGSFEILNDFILMGDGTFFSYTSVQDSIINSESTMKFMWGITFEYNPTNKMLTLLKMVDKTSALAFDTANLSAPNGIQLTKGRLIIQDECYSFNDNSQSNATAIIFGDGTKEGNLLFNRDLMFEQMSGNFVDLTV